MKKINNIKSKIKDFMESKPNYDVTAYEHVKSIGTKYVSIVNLYSCKTSKITLGEFAHYYM